MKTSITFDAYKLAKYVQSKEYMELKGRATLSPMAGAYKKFIRKGRVKDALHPKTKYNRDKKSSLGGHKPLYDTGRLAQSIRYDEKEKAIKGIHYSKYHIEGNSSRGVPKRDFITQVNQKMSDAMFSKEQSKGMRQIGQAIRRVFSRRLAK
jgi:hypothetical protein